MSEELLSKLSMAITGAVSRLAVAAAAGHSGALRKPSSTSLKYVLDKPASSALGSTAYVAWPKGSKGTVPYLSIICVSLCAEPE